MRVTNCILFVALALAQVHAQNAPNAALILPQASSKGTTLGLHVQSNVFTTLGSQFNGEFACDGDGNVYARFRDSEKGSRALQRAPVQEIKANGSLSLAFDAVNAMSDFAISDFFVANDGTVYLIARGTTDADPGWQSYALKFSAAGQLSSTVRINTEQSVFPAHIAAFNSGEILITGRQGAEQNMPFTGIFSAEGKLIKEVFEPEDEELGRRAKAGDSEVVHGSGFGNDAVDLGAVVIGPSDGNAYVMRSVSPAVVFVISKHGEVIRKFRVAADDSLMSPVRLQAFQGGIVVLLARPGSGSVLKVVDSEGNPIATYAIPRGLMGDLACYSPPAFTFVGVEDELLHLYKLEPK